MVLDTALGRYNADIREKFPLSRDMTEEIAEGNGFKHPGVSDYIMTTDFLVAKADGSLHAYSVKPNETLSERSLQILCIEKIYWMQQGVPFDMLFKNKVNKAQVQKNGITVIAIPFSYCFLFK